MAGRTSLMAWFLQSGQVRLVSSVIENPCSGSIHNDVPVYPRWPNEPVEKYLPDCEGDEGVSQPSARKVPGGEDSRRVNSLSVSGRTIGEPPCSMALAKSATSPAQAKTPACPPMPPNTLAFSSCTSP